MLTSHFQTKVALGSPITLTLVTRSRQPPTELFARLWRQIFGFERQFSRFIPESELSQFNRSAGSRQPISSELRAILMACQEMGEQTSGVFNPFVLPALQRHGYKQSAVPGYEQDYVDNHSLKSVVPLGRLELGDTWACIPYGTAIDLGGIGKGYLADLLADKLDAENLAGYWISLGGDMVCAGHDEHEQSWQVSIQSAVSTEKPAPDVIRGTSNRIAIATSGTLHRTTKQQGSKTTHHLIDPRSGQPADTDVILATIIDMSCMRADVLASCAVIVGSQLAADYLRRRHVAGAYIQSSGGTSAFGSAIKSATSQALSSESSRHA